MTRNRQGRGGARRSRRGPTDSKDVEWRSHWKIQTKAAANEIGKSAVGELKGQIGRGIDAKGRPFRPYKADHAKARAARGRQTSRPDLYWTGRFLAKLRAYAAKRLGTARAYVPIGVPSSLRKQARGLVGLGFDWLGLAKRGRRALVKKIKRSRKLFVTKPGPPTSRG